MKYLSTSAHDGEILRSRATKVGPVTYFSIVTKHDDSPDPARFLFWGRLQIARGPLDGLMEGIDEAARVRVLRRRHPSVVISYAPPEPTDDWPDGDPGEAPDA
jgi:hypothetical protein